MLVILVCSSIISLLSCPVTRTVKPITTPLESSADGATHSNSTLFESIADTVVFCGLPLGAVPTITFKRSLSHNNVRITFLKCCDLSGYLRPDRYCHSCYTAAIGEVWIKGVDNEKCITGSCCPL